MEDCIHQLEQAVTGNSSASGNKEDHSVQSTPTIRGTIFLVSTGLDLDLDLFPQVLAKMEEIEVQGLGRRSNMKQSCCGNCHELFGGCHSEQT